MANLRITQMKRRHRRKLILARLRQQYTETSSADKKKRILLKLGKVSPGVTEKQFVAGDTASKA